VAAGESDGIYLERLAGKRPAMAGRLGARASPACDAFAKLARFPSSFEIARDGLSSFRS